MKYYIAINDNQQGPFSIEELMEKHVTKTTLVWTEGLDTWIEADKIEELKMIIKKTPPPINSNRVTFPTNNIKKEKQSNTQIKVNIANEIKIIFKTLLISTIIGIISLPIILITHDFFTNSDLIKKLEIYIANSNNTVTETQGYNDEVYLLEVESKQLGYEYYNYDTRRSEYIPSEALIYHRVKETNDFRNSIKESIGVVIIATIILTLFRYIIKATKWVQKTSSK